MPEKNGHGREIKSRSHRVEICSITIFTVLNAISSHAIFVLSRVSPLALVNLIKSYDKRRTTIRKTTVLAREFAKTNAISHSSLVATLSAITSCIKCSDWLSTREFHKVATNSLQILEFPIQQPISTSDITCHKKCKCTKVQTRL